MRTGTAETVTTIICFSGLTAYFHNLWILVLMTTYLLLFLGFGVSGK